MGRRMSSPFSWILLVYFQRQYPDFNICRNLYNLYNTNQQKSAPSFRSCVIKEDNTFKKKSFHISLTQFLKNYVAF